MRLWLQLFCNCCVWEVKNRCRSDSHDIVAIIAIDLSKVVKMNRALQKQWVILKKMQRSAMI